MASKTPPAGTEQPVNGAPAKTRKARASKPVDLETAAIATLTAALQPLSVPARTRVLGYVNSRLEENGPEKEN
jgi:hypothetical protein